ncbi:hypothetical protein QCA50_004251 [Cerrena zonata]|uniref:Uncharacterized protein n=1 Tax=Cerrena zonata TaxID=2478898 RepID=A0AAW0GSX7_9APHY
MANSQHKTNKKTSRTREVRQITAKHALQKREKTRKGVSKAKISELTDELNRQYAQVQLQPTTPVEPRRLVDVRPSDESVQDLADVLGSI